MPQRCTMNLATRESELALAQTREVWDALAARFPGQIDLHNIVVKTSGDVLKDAALRDFGGKGAFIREIDGRVLAGKADVAVHSLKDIPTRVHEELTVAAVLPRPAFTDALVSNVALEDLSPAARIGTSSVRRKAMVLRARPDVEVEAIRGNVPTRVQKWREGRYDAVVLSTAGLRRLGIDAPYRELDSTEFVPEPGQGAVACVCKKGSRFEEFLEAIDDPPTRTEVEAEREVLHALGGGCVAPVGAHASHRGAQIDLHAIVLSLDGQREVALRELIPATEPIPGADELAGLMKRMGADTLLDEARRVLG